MNMEKLIVPTILILAITGIVYRATRAPLEEKAEVDNAIEQTAIIEEITGMMVYGHEVRSFRVCGDTEQDASWMLFADPAMGNTIRTSYETETDGRIPYTPVLATIKTEQTEPLTEGFGADYSKAYIVHELQKIDANATCLQDEIILDQPLSGGPISSPLMISGQARGTWFFEANMSAVLTNWDGEIIAESPITTEDEWTTEEFVNFSGEIEFETPQYGKVGHLIIQAANPSDLPENDRALEILVEFAQDINTDEEAE